MREIKNKLIGGYNCPGCNPPPTKEELREKRKNAQKMKKKVKKFLKKIRNDKSIKKTKTSC